MTDESACPNCGNTDPPNWPEPNELECRDCGYTEIVDPRNRSQEP